MLSPEREPPGEAAAAPEATALATGVRGGRLAFVDGWRAIAVGLVVVGHLLGAQSNFALLGAAQTAVHGFFLISGFIISWLSIQEQRQTGRFSQSDFIARRVLRILPPLLLYLFVVVALNWRDLPAMAVAAARAATFSCNINVEGQPCTWLVAHTWSLAFEEQFYLLFPFLLTRRLNTWFWPVLAILLLPIIFPVNFIGRIGFVQVMLLFACGIGYAQHKDKVDAVLRRLPWVVHVAALGFLIFWLALQPGPLQKVLGLIEPVAIFLIVFGAPAKSATIRRALGNRLLTRIGLYSYSIYLWQQLFLQPGDEAAWVYALGALAAVVISGASYHYYEVYFRRLSTRFFSPLARACGPTARVEMSCSRPFP